MPTIIRSRHFEIYRVPGNREAILAAHGGYNPPRYPPVYIPTGLRVHFYAIHNNFGKCPQAGSMLASGTAPTPHEKARWFTTDYYYSHHPTAAAFQFSDSSPFDLIRVVAGTLADDSPELSELFKVFSEHSLHYKILHNFACRVDATKSTGQISGPG